MTLIVVLALVGMALVLTELVVPGGVLGVGGFVCLVAAVILTFVNYGSGAGGLAFTFLLVFGFVTLGLWMKNFHRLPFTKRLVLRQAIDDNTEELRLQELIGKQGITLTKIAPSGHIEIDGAKIDVMTESGVIDKGTAVTIIETRGPSVFVEPS